MAALTAWVETAGTPFRGSLVVALTRFDAGGLARLHVARCIGGVQELNQQTARFECPFGHPVFRPFAGDNCRLVNPWPEYTIIRLVIIASHKDMPKREPLRPSLLTPVPAAAGWA